jgi:hypothetical protein
MPRLAQQLAQWLGGPQATVDLRGAPPLGAPLSGIARGAATAAAKLSPFFRATAAGLGTAVATLGRSGLMAGSAAGVGAAAASLRDGSVAWNAMDNLDDANYYRTPYPNGSRGTDTVGNVFYQAWITVETQDPSITSNTRYFVSTESQSPTEYGISLFTNGLNDTLVMKSRGSSSAITVSGPIASSLVGVPIHVVGAIVGGVAKLWLNAVRTGADVTVPAGNYNAPVADIAIGRRPGAPETDTNSCEDVIRIHGVSSGNVASVSDAEVLAAYNAGLAALDIVALGGVKTQHMWSAKQQHSAAATWVDVIDGSAPMTRVGAPTWLISNDLVGGGGGGGGGGTSDEFFAYEPYGLGSHWNESSKYAQYKAAGVQWIRIDANWDEQESTQGSLTWSNVDVAVTEANRVGIKVLLVLQHSPSWASVTGDQYGAFHEAYDGAWQNFVNQAATRYSGQVIFEVYNEPDLLPGFLRIGPDCWAVNHYPGSNATDQRRLQYKHIVDLALATALGGERVTTSGMAEGGGIDDGMRAWLVSQPGWYQQFVAASYHCYGYPSYNRLVDVPASYRTMDAANGYTWGHWITEHGINTTGVSDSACKTYTIRSMALALSQTNVAKFFWFRGGADPSHMNFLNTSDQTTAVYAAYQLVTSKWAAPVSVAPFTHGTAAGAIATLTGGAHVAIVWNDGSGIALNALGLSITSAFNQDGGSISTSTSLGSSPVFLLLT